ncbi:MAG: hypothetical protein LBC75_01430 [Fibromonadaceae bacterium]|jgi:hypothetical protein|nr:hypothetical protein [Fibromonadaceae bacterium]
MEHKELENKVMGGKFTFLKRIFAAENRWGIYIGVIVAVIGGVSNYFFPSLQIVSYILQGVTVIVLTESFGTVINHCQRETIESATKIAILKIDEKYEKISCYSTNLFEIFQLNNGANYCNITHNIFFNKLIESYTNNGKKRKYYIPTDTYYEIIKSFLVIGYKMKTINGVLLPFWYVPKEKDDALKQYTLFCQNHTDLCERVTYYQDFNDDSWRDNTVKMIYLDLLHSEKSDDVAVRWLITLVANIENLKTVFGNDIEKILGQKLTDIDYLQHHNNEQFNAAIKKNISNISEFLEQKYNNTTNSSEMTTIINNLFSKEMKGKNKFVKKSEIDTRFKNVVDFEEVTEIGYYYKDDYQFVMFLNGSNTGPSIELEIIIEKDKIAKIQPILDDLF